MSIRDEINKMVESKRLFCLSPLIASTAVIRTLFVSFEVHDQVFPPFAENRDGYRLSQFRSTLDTFSSYWISVAENPYKKDQTAFMARVDPIEDEVWDIRSIDPRPGIRCLGRFAEKDTFIALTWDYRENFNWKYEIQRCKEVWKELFGTTPPLAGASLDDYLSGNYHAV